jgi:hypothetical protein
MFDCCWLLLRTLDCCWLLLFDINCCVLLCYLVTDNGLQLIVTDWSWPVLIVARVREHGGQLPVHVSPGLQAVRRQVHRRGRVCGAAGSDPFRLFTPQ